jgi:hypothetical protein
MLAPACLLNAGNPQAQTSSWYKCFNGNIDKYPVSLHLHKSGHQYAGYYYYTSRQEPVSLAGEDTTQAGKIVLTAYLPEEATESFVFSVTGSSAAGEWKESAKGRTLPFSATEAPSPLDFDFIYAEGVSALRPGMKESPVASFDAASVWPKGSTVQASLLKRIIRETFNETNSTEEIGRIFLRQKKRFFTDYLAGYKDVKIEELEDGYAYNMDQTDRVMIAYQSPKLVVLARSWYSYTGGAHGNYGTSYIAVNLVNNKKIRLSDVVSAAGQGRLASLLEKSFRTAYHEKDSNPLSEGGLFEDKIEPNDNFFVTGKGIGFCYNPYEIGPYALGEIDIFIPYTDLDAYLQPGFKKLITP